MSPSFREKSKKFKVDAYLACRCDIVFKKDDCGHVLCAHGRRGVGLRLCLSLAVSVQYSKYFLPGSSGIDCWAKHYFSVDPVLVITFIFLFFYLFLFFWGFGVGVRTIVLTNSIDWYPLLNLGICTTMQGSVEAVPKGQADTREMWK